MSALLDPSKEIRDALEQLPVPESASEMYEPVKISSSVKSVLMENHYTRNMVEVSEAYGAGGYNHLAERYQDIGHFKDMTIDEHQKWWGSSKPNSVVINNEPVHHWRIGQWFRHWARRRRPCNLFPSRQETHSG